MIRRPPRYTRTDTLFPYTTLFRSGPGRAVVELGSGSSTKTPLLLDAIDPAAYVPVDISGDFLLDSAEGLAARFPGLAIYPVEAYFTQRIELPRVICPPPPLAFFPGSPISNLVARTAIHLFRTWLAALADGSLLLVVYNLF